MQQGWDDLDKKIVDSNNTIKLSENYNYVLLEKIRDKRTTHNENQVAALSLITAGFLLIIVYTANLESSITKVEYQIQTGINILECGFNCSSNYIFGE